MRTAQSCKNIALFQVMSLLNTGTGVQYYLHSTQCVSSYSLYCSCITSNVRASQGDFLLKLVVVTKPGHPFSRITSRLTNTDYCTLGFIQALLTFFPYSLVKDVSANYITILYLTGWNKRQFSSISKVVFNLIQLQLLRVRWLDEANNLGSFCRYQRIRATSRVRFKRQFCFKLMS